jgi:hypothetical protein
MSAHTPAAPALPLFITLARFQDFGLPGRTRAYDLAKVGLLDLRKDAAGRVGVTGTEAQRFANSARPIAETKRDLAANHSRNGRPVARRVSP